MKLEAMFGVAVMLAMCWPISACWHDDRGPNVAHGAVRADHDHDHDHDRDRDRDRDKDRGHDRNDDYQRHE